MEKLKGTKRIFPHYARNQCPNKGNAVIEREKAVFPMLWTSKVVLDKDYHTDDLDWIESSKNIEPKINIPLDCIMRLDTEP